MASHKIKRQGGRQRRERERRMRQREKEGARNRSDKRGAEREKQGYCRAEDSWSARTKVWRKKCTKIRCSFSCTEHSKRERLSREEQANDLALNERKETERWRGCVLFCLSVKTLRSLLHAACYQC